MAQDNLETHVKILGWLYLISNALFLLLGILGLVFMAGIGVLSGDLEALPILTFIGGIGFIFFAVLGLPGMVAGYGLLARKSWGRVLALVVGVLGVLNFPIGTAIGAYTLIVLAPETSADYFTKLKVA